MSRPSSSKSRSMAFGFAMAFTGVLAVVAPRGAGAGQGSSPEAILTAIGSGSPDAIKAELERAEHLVCAACVDYVLPLIDDGDAGIREVAAWWLIRRGASRPVFRDMLTRLGEPNSLRARNAADVLGAFALPQAIPALGAALSNPIFTPEARVAMAVALGKIHRPEAAAPLTAALVDCVPEVRAAALAALRHVDGLGDGRVAIPLLGDADQGVRVQAIFTVAERRTADAAAPLVNLLENDPSASVRRRAAWALGQIHASAAIASDPLGQAANSDASPLVRSLARASLAALSR